MGNFTASKFNSRPPRPVETLTVPQEVMKQYRQESRGVRFAEDILLKQKYGLVAPQLTGAENNLVRKEARDSGN